MNNVELQNIVGGQLQEKFKHAFEKVVENLQDPNTSYKVKRGINIKLDFTQTEARDKREGEQEADFISCVAFGKNGEFAEKYLFKGMRIAVVGRIQTGSYEKDGTRHYTTDVVVEEHEFCESKGSGSSGAAAPSPDEPGFMNIPDGIDEELPFS